MHKIYNKTISNRKIVTVAKKNQMNRVNNKGDLSILQVP